jgi:hypothetical protein
MNDVNRMRPDDAANLEQIVRQKAAEPGQVQERPAANEALDVPAQEGFEPLGTPSLLCLAAEQEDGLRALLAKTLSHRHCQPVRSAEAIVENAVQHPDPWLVFRIGFIQATQTAKAS